jgi:hypothetical protein
MVNQPLRFGLACLVDPVQHVRVNQPVNGLEQIERVISAPELVVSRYAPFEIGSVMSGVMVINRRRALRALVMT